MADIEASHKPDKADRIEIEATKTLSKWYRHLSAGVSNAFDCQVIHQPSTGMMSFIGVGADAHVAAYTFTYLSRTVRKLCSTYMKSHVSDRVTGRNRELRRQSYYLGVVTTINERLREQKVCTPVTPGALVHVKEALIRQTMNEIGNLRTVHSRRSYVHSEAYIKGQNDGSQVSIHKGLAQVAKKLSLLNEA